MLPQIFLSCLLFTVCLSDSTTKVKSPVLELNEKFLDVMNNGFWFIKFYAPWCAHCKRLAPTWEHLAHGLEDINSRVKVGKVDCTRFTTACSALRINAYPTIIFFRNGIKIPYENERKKEAMMDFVIKSSGPVVSPIKTSKEYMELQKNSEKDPIFVFVNEKTGEKNPKAENLYLQFDAVAEQLFTESRFTKIEDLKVLGNVKIEKFPTIMVLKDGASLIYNEETNPDLYSWILSERWTLIPQATASNIHSLGKSGKKLVLIVSDFIDKTNMTTLTGKFFKIAKESAKLVRDDENLSRKFQFAWLDGNQIANNIAMMNIEIPDLMVFNQTSYEFYLNVDSSNETTPQSIITFLQNIDDGEYIPMGGRSWGQRIRRMIYDITTNIYDMFKHQPILTVCLFGVPTAFFAIIVYTICASDFSVDREEIYPEDEDDSEAELMKNEESETQEIEGPRRRRKNSTDLKENESEQSYLTGDEDENSDANSDHEKAD